MNSGFDTVNKDGKLSEFQFNQQYHNLNRASKKQVAFVGWNRTHTATNNISHGFSQENVLQCIKFNQDHDAKFRDQDDGRFV